MAYVSKEKKEKIAAALKAVMPKDWKYSLRVDNGTSIVMTLRSAPVDLVGLCKYEHGKDGYIQLNHFYIENAYADPTVVEILRKAVEALNTDNFDNSDSQSDYFHVGHYVNLHVGRWDKPFVVKS